MFFLLLLAKAVLTVAATTAVVATVVAITYSAIKEWYEPLLQNGFTGTISREDLENATVVKVGLRNPYGTLVHEKAFTGTLDDEMKAKFAGRDRITLRG